VVTTSGPSGSVFVGRQREMAVLNAALDDAMAGQGRLVMPAGEPGIGKTRIAQELASRGPALLAAPTGPPAKTPGGTRLDHLLPKSWSKSQGYCFL